MTKEKMYNLALLSIEQKLCGRVIYNNTLNDFAEIEV